MDFGAELGFAWRFARNRERISLYLLFFLAALAAGSLVVLLLVALAGGALGAGSLQNLLRSSGSAFALVGGAILLLLLLVVLFFVFVGAWLWISAAVIKSAASEYSGASGARLSLRECLAFAKTRFWTLVATVILVAVASFVVELPLSLLQLVPRVGLFFLLVGVVVRIVLALAFFFAQYAAVVSEDNAVDALRNSVGIFLKNPLEVLLTLILLVVAAVSLFVVLLVPSGALAFLAAIVVGAVKGVAGMVLGAVIGLTAFLVFIAGIAFLEVFLEGFLTAAFLDLGGGQPSVAPAGALLAPRAAARRPPVARKRAAPKKK